MYFIHHHKCKCYKNFRNRRLFVSWGRYTSKLSLGQLCRFYFLLFCKQKTRPSFSPFSLLVPVAAHSYHPLECPAQGFLPTAGTETAASLSQSEECFWKHRNRKRRISWFVAVNGYYHSALREATVFELKIKLFYFAEWLRCNFLSDAFKLMDPQDKVFVSRILHSFFALKVQKGRQECLPAQVTADRHQSPLN